MTTFARIAKIIMGTISPRNWIESAFAELANGGGGGGVFEVTDTQEGNAHTLDKTFGEIEAAIEAGKTVWITVGSLGSSKRMATLFDSVVQTRDSYEGSIGFAAESASYWYVTGDTEEEARNSYPSYEY